MFLTSMHKMDYVVKYSIGEICK